VSITNQTKSKMEITQEQLNELAQIRTALVGLYNSNESPDFTLVRKVDALVNKLNEPKEDYWELKRKYEEERRNK